MDAWYRCGQALEEEIRNLTLSEGELAFWFLGQCGFAFRYGQKLLLIDPVLNDIIGDDEESRRNYPAPFSADMLKPDYVLCTHGHIDHLALPTVCSFTGAKILLPSGCRRLAENAGIAESDLIPMENGSSVSLDGGITVRAVSAAHPIHVFDSDNPDMALSYCVDFGSYRAVHLGDTYLTEKLLRSLESMEKINLFLPPINGDDRFRAMHGCIGNMEAEEAAKLAVHLGAEFSIPTHYDMIAGNTVDPLRFAVELRKLNSAAKWKIPAPGECIIVRI